MWFGIPTIRNWDSYWIILGLIASELLPAAEQLLRNLLGLVDAWGFVPNGARTYYTNRSQPPLLSAMVLAVWSAGGDDQLLVDALPRLVAQHHYWTGGNKAVALAGAPPSKSSLKSRGVQDEAGEVAGSTERSGVFMLSRYHAELYGPRPESYREDVHLVARAGLEGPAAAQLYCDIASAAESGWDFSSRWFVGGDSLEHTRTTQIVPADLNAWLYRMEKDIAAIAAHLGDTLLHDRYMELAERRLAAINTLMWSADDHCWHDLELCDMEASDASNACDTQDPRSCGATPSSNSDGSGTQQQRNMYTGRQRTGVYASNWVPLWCGCAESGSSQAASAVRGLLSSGLVREGGLLTSLYPSGQQWDAPNAWPPLVHMAIEGLAESGTAEGATAASSLAGSWVRANLAAWQATGHMHEKLDATRVGGVGGGGEYTPQVGFGWSNGVLLDLLRRQWETP
ncbi:hypothetical protein GPECTOR_70g484 [Gonium pectorale]|uniref:Trehalase n=1 Tax=Gonium pectorale TaxID=33097 RepID=A0A150G363_GONPE|nr:hypothetical protein GPECTOR_70g484 [Gonium pectorale]|eukprot:KXZ44253.1 hypothetical protein GPECTOR_70g484 [Gonium pectorale]